MHCRDMKEKAYEEHASLVCVLLVILMSNNTSSGKGNGIRNCHRDDLNSKYS